MTISGTHSSVAMVEGDSEVDSIYVQRLSDANVELLLLPTSILL